MSSDRGADDYVTRFHLFYDPRVQVGTVTHGGPNQWKCGICFGTGDARKGLAPNSTSETCGGCNGKGWYAHAR